jgi:hypothetical protein
VYLSLRVSWFRSPAETAAASNFLQAAAASTPDADDEPAPTTPVDQGLATRPLEFACLFSVSFGMEECALTPTFRLNVKHFLWDALGDSVTQ